MDAVVHKCKQCGKVMRYFEQIDIEPPICSIECWNIFTTVWSDLIG